MDPYRESEPMIVERIKRVEWAWPATIAVSMTVIGFLGARVILCKQERDRFDREHCRDAVINMGGNLSSQFECPYPEQTIDAVFKQGGWALFSLPFLGERACVRCGAKE